MANSATNLPEKSPGVESLPPELLERLIAVQESQLSLNLKGQESSHQYSMASLEAEFRERSEDRKFVLKVITGQRILLGSMVVILLVFTGIVLAMGKDAIAVEILKALGFFFAGGSVGWGLHRKSDATKRTIE